MAIENLTTYTEVDPNGRITVTPSRSTFTSLTRNEDAYVYDDKGTGHFDGNFEHLVTVYFSSAAVYGFSAAWCLASEIDDWQAIFEGAGSLLDVALYHNDVTGNFRIDLHEVYGASQIAGDNYICSLDTVYYLKIKRDETVGTYGTLYCYIYSDAGRTNLLHTLSLALHAKTDFRYIYAAQSRNSGNSTYKITGYVENLDLQEAPLVISRGYIIG